MEIVKSIKKIKGSPKDWRTFGLVIGALFLLLAISLWYRHHYGYENILIISGLFLIPAAISPFLLFFPYKLWMSFAVVLSWITTILILLILYFLIITPLGFILRKAGYQFSGIFDTSNKGSYWLANTRKKPKIEDYEHQY
jgi:hypothetical protein